MAPWRGPRQAPSSTIKRADVPVSTPRRAEDRAIDRGENYCLKIRSAIPEMLMKTLPAGSALCHPFGRQTVRDSVRRGDRRVSFARSLADPLARTATEN